MQQVKQDLHSEFRDKPPRQNIPIMPWFLRPVPYIPLMQVAVLLICCELSLTTVRGAPMVMNIGEGLDDARQDALINMARREVGLAEV